MSGFERRLQLLLDEERLAMVQREAHESGRSLAAVIREAIDLRFAGASPGERRAAAADFLLALPAPTSPEPDWSERLADQQAELDARLR